MLLSVVIGCVCVCVLFVGRCWLLVVGIVDIAAAVGVVLVAMVGVKIVIVSLLLQLPVLFDAVCLIACSITRTPHLG
jgi:hypothetical protein